MDALQEKNQTETLKAKNDFRDEVARGQVSPEEELRRGQNVHLLQLQTRKKMSDADKTHLESTICMLESAQNALSLMQDCEYKDAAAGSCQKEIDILTKRMEETGLGEINSLTLASMEELQILRGKVNGAGFNEKKETIED